MAAQATSETLAPVYLHAGSESVFDAGELRAAQEGKFVKVPSGWSAVHGYRTTLTVSFAASQDLTMPPGMILGDTDAPAPPIVATENIPALYLSLERGAETCHVEVAQTRTELSKVWSRASTQGPTMAPTRLGLAAVAGPTAVIDAGETLIRATYFQPNPNPRSPEADYQHLDRCRQGAQEFLDGLLA
jgi:hypothetical protein